MVQTSFLKKIYKICYFYSCAKERAILLSFTLLDPFQDFIFTLCICDFSFLSVSLDICGSILHGVDNHPGILPHNPDGGNHGDSRNHHTHPLGTASPVIAE